MLEVKVQGHGSKAGGQGQCSRLRLKNARFKRLEVKVTVQVQGSRFKVKVQGHSSRSRLKRSMFKRQEAIV